MQIYQPGKTMIEECSGYNAVRYFPYLAARLDALKEIRETERQLHLFSDFNRKYLMTGRGIGPRFMSLPFHVVVEQMKTYGNEFMYDVKLQRKFLRENPEWRTTEANII
jgi:hypothetical protein